MFASPYDRARSTRPSSAAGQPVTALRRLLWPLVLLLLGLTGCEKQTQAPLRVLAAQSLIDAFTAMKTAYEQAHPGVQLEVTTASSGQLRAQIEGGAPADVFASASQHHMDLLAKKALVLADTRQDFAGNRLVLVVPPQSELRALKELTAAAVSHVAIGDWTHVPAGRYAREVLVNQGLFEPLQAKLRQCQNVRQVLTYVAAGEVEAGFVYQTDAIRERERVKVVWTAPPTSHTAIRLPIAVITGSQRQGEAKRFVDFVSSPTGQAIMKEHGFVVPPPTAASAPPTGSPPSAAPTTG
jgi:molybdate transport system substrate-binding protein